jgi:signal peptidase I
MTVARRLLASLAGLAIVVITAGLVLAWHQGYRIWVVHTGSMIPTLQPGEAIVDQPVRGRPHRGELITFRYASGPDQVVTHRVYRESGGTIRTKGDANPTEDPWTLRASQVVGIPTAIIPDGGYIVVYLSQPSGAASVVTFTIMITLLWGLCFPGRPADAGREPERDREPERRTHRRVDPRTARPLVSPAAGPGRRAGGRAAGPGHRSPRPAVR